MKKYPRGKVNYVVIMIRIERFRIVSVIGTNLPDRSVVSMDVKAATHQRLARAGGPKHMGYVSMYRDTIT